MAAPPPSSSSSSPCAACKFLRRKCTPSCVFAPYFPADHPGRFANVHKVFGASNVTKLLRDLPPHQRDDAVNSLAYEAEARIRDPVYGCVGAISILQRQVAILEQELALAQSDLTARYLAAAAAAPHALPPADPHPPCAAASPAPLPPTPSATCYDLHLLLDQLQRDTCLPREQLVEQLRRVGGGSLEAGIGALASCSAGAGGTPSSRASPVASVLSSSTVTLASEARQQAGVAAVNASQGGGRHPIATSVYKYNNSNNYDFHNSNNTSSYVNNNSSNNNSNSNNGFYKYVGSLT